MKPPPESDECNTSRNFFLVQNAHHHVLMGAFSLVVPVSKTGRSIEKKLVALKQFHAWLPLGDGGIPLELAQLK